jgi:glycosyltransferase involved in cell wall biosynthesis
LLRIARARSAARQLVAEVVPMAARPTCSLIITTYNAEAALDIVLRSVIAQTVLPDEVLVADDGSGPATAELLARHAASFPVPLRHVWHEDQGFRLTAIRNRALAVARGAYIIMLDGDMVLHPKFVASHLSFARVGSYVQGSRVLLRRELTARFMANPRMRIRPLTRGVGNRINAVHAPALAWLYRGPRGVRRMRGANMAYWLHDAKRVNGFNEDCVGWGAEDMEFAARLQNAGVRRRNLKFAGVAYHLHHTTRPSDSEPANMRLYERAVREHLTWCENGLDKYLGSRPTVGATGGRAGAFGGEPHATPDVAGPQGAR